MLLRDNTLLRNSLTDFVPDLRVEKKLQTRNVRTVAETQPGASDDKVRSQRVLEARVECYILLQFQC